jgi:arylsulfatase A-like enzyme
MGQYRLRPGKQTAFDTDIRVPLVVTGPGVPAGRSIRAITASIDLAPTFAQLARTGLPRGTDGISMLPLWHGRVPASWPTAVLIEHHHPRYSLDDPDRQTVPDGVPPTYEAIRTPNALYVEYAGGATEYYDLRTDPHELNNLAATASRTVLGPLRHALHALEKCAGGRACAVAAGGS